MVLQQQLITPASPTKTGWHTQEAAHVLAHFSVVADTGLTDEIVQARQKQYGANELIERALKSPWTILREQLTNPLVLLLIFAAVISALLGKVDSVIAIGAIVILNAVLGVVQEYRAEQAMAALKKMAAPMVRVRRDGRVLEIAARELVPGDVILLEAGSIVPADARLLYAASLRVQEASLTGESQPVDKSAQVLDDDNAPIGDRHNMLYVGTAVTYGRGTAVVVETGMNTQLGRIAELIQSVESEKTPLQKRMDELGGVLIKAAFIVMAIAFIIGIASGQTFQNVLLNAVAIAVAVVPEGLPAIVTIALALGAQRMLKRSALIRKLPAVETLGSVTTICSDKTGTLTENRMTVTVVDVAGHSTQIEEVLQGGMPSLLSLNGTGITSPHASQAILLLNAALCNDAVLEPYSNPQDQQAHQYTTIGDPTEGALLIAAARFNLLKPHLEQAFPRVSELPFDSERKRMTTVHTFVNDNASETERYLAGLLNLSNLHEHTHIAFTKGAVDGLLNVCSDAWIDGEIVRLTPDIRIRVERATDQLAQAGLRVLGLAYRTLDQQPTQWNETDLEQHLIFVGMVGIIDPPRKEVKEAIRVCLAAGIRPVMITGDHPLTAYAIARELGIVEEGGQVLTGHALSQMTQDELEAQVEQVSVYARVSPEHKLNIVQALQRKGHVAAMTGDGVNDAPALKRSDIGVAMGITGTAVSKEASDVVILDDNFATIVSAVEEGRTIYDNVRRFIKYLLASNAGELIVLLTTQLIAGMTIPLTTLQILWMNLITDGIPALALGVEKGEPKAMQRAPYAPSESLFGRGLGRHILLIGSLLGVIGIGLGYWAWSNNVVAANGAPAWNTMVFFFLTIAQMGHALGLRSHRDSFFTLKFLGNPLLIGAVATTLLLQLLAIYTPFFNNLFNTNPLTLEQLGLCFALSTVVFIGVELEKLAMRRGWLAS